MENKSPEKTDRIYLTGFMGSGKSAVGRILARLLRRRFVDLDDVITREAGMSIPEIFRRKGEKVFREMEREIAARYVTGKWVVALGGGTIMDPGIRGLLMDSGVVAYLRARGETLADRLRGKTGHRPVLAGEESLEKRITTLMEERGPVYEGAGWVVDTDGFSEGQVASLLFRRVRGEADD